MPLAAICSAVTVLLVLIQCYFMLPLFVRFLFLVIVFMQYLSTFLDIISRRKRAGCFILIVLLLLCGCWCSVSLPCDGMGWPLVCKCAIACSFSFTIFKERQLAFLLVVFACMCKCKHVFGVLAFL